MELRVAHQVFGGVIDDHLQPCPGNGEPCWMFLRGVGQLGIIGKKIQEAVCRTLDLERAPVRDDSPLGLPVGAQGNIPLEAELRSHDRTDQKRDDPIMSDDESCVFFLPGPPGQCDGKEIDTKNPEPCDEPRRLVNPGLGHRGIKMGLREGCRGDGDGDRGKKDERKLQGTEKMNQAPQGVSSLTIRDQARPGEGAFGRSAVGGHPSQVRERDYS